MKIDMTYEQAINRLEEIINKLEESDVSLDDALKLYEEGTALTAYCNSKLNEAKQKIVEIKKD